MLTKVGLRVGLINGNVSAPKRAKIDEAFRAGQLDVVVASPDTAGIGFNWGHCDHIIFASLDYKDTAFFQAYRRCMRDKREKPLWITVLYYEELVDERVMDIIEWKSTHANKVDPTREVIKLRPDAPPPPPKREKKVVVPMPVSGSPLDDEIPF